MEYDFLHDAITGKATAIFSTEHEVIGPWLEVEIGYDREKFKALLVAIDAVDQGQENEVAITGSEYTVTIDQQDVTIETNVSMNGAEPLSEELQEQQLDIDSTSVASCGLEDFREVMMSWAKFIKV